MLTLPFESMRNGVEVAKAAVEEEMAKRGVVPPAEPAMERRAKGEVVAL